MLLLRRNHLAADAVCKFLAEILKLLHLNILPETSLFQLTASYRKHFYNIYPDVTVFLYVDLTVHSPKIPDVSPSLSLSILKILDVVVHVTVAE